MTFEQFAPAIVAAFPVCVVIITYGGRLVNLARDAKRDVEDVKKEIAEIKPKVDMVLVLQQSVADTKTWVDRIERRLDRLEVKGGS